MKMNSWDIQGQEERRKQVYELHRQYMFDTIDDNGQWHGTGSDAGFRERLWHCLPLLDGEEKHVYRANRIIELTELKDCHFTPMTSMQILLKYEVRLTTAARNKLEDYVKKSLPAAMEDSIHFTMYNDNFAALNTFTLLTAGERFGDTKAFEAGLEKLNQLKEVFMRRGTIMEYNSRTYTPLTAHVMAEIANYIKDGAVRELALKCEERMMAEIAVRFHAPTSHMAGPYSRSYNVDSVGHPHLIDAFVYYVFGEKVFINPVNDMYPPRENQEIHCGIDTLMWPNLVWLCSGDCHCPDYLAEVFLNKSFPFSAVTTSECLPSGEYSYLQKNMDIEYPAVVGIATSYMTEDFGLGTASSQYCDGSLSDTFHTVYRKKVPAAKQEDVGVAYSRYIINDRIPGTVNDVDGSMQPREGFADDARKFCLQDRDCALVAYKPKHFRISNVYSLKLSILLPCHYNTVEEIWLGDRKVEAFKGESTEMVTVFVKDGPVYMAFRPMEFTNYGRKAAVRVEKVENYVMISFYNYEGPAKSFEPKEIKLTSAGFVVHVKQLSEMRNLREFMDMADSGTLSDRMTSQLGGHVRRIRYTNKDTDLNFVYSPITEGILVDTINGRPREASIFKATGVDSSKLPFLNK